MKSDTRITDISAGKNHNLILTQDQQLFAWGCNSQGQCGQIIQQHQVLYTPFKVLHPLKNQEENITQIECGENFSGFLNNGEVYTFGGNENGQLGLGFYDSQTNITQPTKIIMDCQILQMSFGYRHILMLTNQDTVYGAGLNAYYELGLGTIDNMNACFPQPVRIASLDGQRTQKVIAGSFSAVINGKNEIVIWGTGEFGQIKNP